MSNNEINITLNISDELLAKLMMAMKPQGNQMGIPLQALMGMTRPPQALPKGEEPQKKPPVGFKTNKEQA